MTFLTIIQLIQWLSLVASAIEAIRVGKRVKAGYESVKDLLLPFAGCACFFLLLLCLK